MLDLGRLDMFRLVFDQFGEMFDEIKNQPFTVEWLKEETELIFWIGESGRRDHAAYLFRRGKKGYCYEQREAESSLCGLTEAAGERYQYRNVNIADNLQMNIWVFCQSPYFKINTEALFFRTVFKLFNIEMDTFLENLEFFNWDVDRTRREAPKNWFRDLPRNVIAEATKKICDILQTNFKLVKIDDINRWSEKYYEKLAGQLGFIFLRGVIPIADLPVFVHGFRSLVGTEAGTEFDAEKISQIERLPGEPYFVFDVCGDGEKYQVLGICEKQHIYNLIHHKDGTDPYIIVEVKKPAEWNLYIGDIYVFSHQNGRYIIEVDMPEEFSDG